VNEERWVVEVGEKFFEFTSVKGGKINLCDGLERAWRFRSREAAVSKKQALNDLGFEGVSVQKVHGGIK